MARHHHGNAPSCAVVTWKHSELRSGDLKTLWVAQWWDVTMGTLWVAQWWPENTLSCAVVTWKHSELRSGESSPWKRSELRSGDLDVGYFLVTSFNIPYSSHYWTTAYILFSFWWILPVWSYSDHLQIISELSGKMIKTCWRPLKSRQKFCKLNI